MSKSNSTLARPSHSQTVEVKGLNGLMGNLNSDVKHLIQQGSTYNFYGKNNQVILNDGGELIYADTQPPPFRHPSFLEGWFYINQNAGDKFNYYFFSNTTFTLPASSVKGQFAIFENQALTTSNVNVLLAIYTGDFFTGGRQVYTSNQRMEIGVKYLVYWGEDPQIFPELPRIEYTLASERNWNPNEPVLTMSVGSDSGYTAGTVNNLMTHMGYLTESGAVISTLIGSRDNVNSSSQLVQVLNQIKSRLDLNLELAVLETIRDNLTTQFSTVNSNLVVLAEKLDELIALGEGGGGGGSSPVVLRSIIPDTDPLGNAITIGLEEQVYTWAFTTGDGTQYDLYAQTNGEVIGDDEKILKMYLAGDENETTILDPTMFFSKNENEITMDLPEGEGDYVINFMNNKTGETPQAEITLLSNTEYRFKVITQFNDNDDTNPDIRFAITPVDTFNSLDLNYVGVVSGGGGGGGV